MTNLMKYNSKTRQNWRTRSTKNRVFIRLKNLFSKYYLTNTKQSISLNQNKYSDL